MEREQNKYIALKKKNFKGEETEITVDEILKYENVKSCNLFYFKISKQDIETLNKPAKLVHIKFDMCYFDVENIDLQENVKSINFNICENLKMKYLKNSKAEEITINQLKKSNIEINLAELELLKNLNKLAIHNCKVKGLEDFMKKAPNIKCLDLDGSVVDNREELIKLAKKIKVTNEDEYYIVEA